MNCDIYLRTTFVNPNLPTAVKLKPKIQADRFFQQVNKLSRDLGYDLFKNDLIDVNNLRQFAKACFSAGATFFADSPKCLLLDRVRQLEYKQFNDVVQMRGMKNEDQVFGAIMGRFGQPVQSLTFTQEYFRAFASLPSIFNLPVIVNLFVEPTSRFVIVLTGKDGDVPYDSTDIFRSRLFQMIGGIATEPNWGFYKNPAGSFLCFLAYFGFLIQDIYMENETSRHSITQNNFLSVPEIIAYSRGVRKSFGKTFSDLCKQVLAPTSPYDAQTRQRVRQLIESLSTRRKYSRTN